MAAAHDCVRAQQQARWRLPNAFLAEATHDFGDNSVYGRFEALQVETDVLRFGDHTFVGSSTVVAHEHVPESGEGRDVVGALTLGAVRTLAKPWGWDFGAGADVTFYSVPDPVAAVLRQQPGVVPRLLPYSTAGADGANVWDD